MRKIKILRVIKLVGNLNSTYRMGNTFQAGTMQNLRNFELRQKIFDIHNHHFLSSIYNQIINLNPENKLKPEIISFVYINRTHIMIKNN